MVRLYQMVGVLLALASATSVCAQESFPYVAYVVHDDAYVRSGPGQRYYPTQQLSQGFAVEVYRHDGDGWCAIRPPEGSFSWISARDVRTVDGNVAEVTAERVVTRVGSTLSPTRTAVQVLLERGERLSLAPGASADPDWLRVVAPAGEFRWIAARDLGRQAPLEVTPPTAPTNAWASSSPSAAPTASEPNAFNHLVQAAATTPLPTIAAAEQVDVVAGSPAELQLAQFQGQSSNSLAAPGLIDPRSSAMQSTAPRIRLGSPATVAAPTYTAAERPDRVREIELELSQIVSQAPQHWELGTLQAEANAMLQQTEDVQTQVQLRDLVDRMARFQQIHDGYDQIAQPGAAPVTNNPLPSAAPPGDPVTEIVQNVRQRVREDLAAPAAGLTPTAGVTEEPLYDAIGMLKPVVSQREGAPQYALVDGRGDVVSFVTPTPDINLQPYVGRRIGVNGSRGFMNEFNRAHVTAGRVTPIDSTMRR